MRPDLKLQRLCDGQLGLATTQQILDCEISAKQLHHRVKIGQLIRMYHAVYRTSGSTRSYEQRVLAAVLAAGEGAVAAGRAASRVYGLVEGAPEPEVLVPSHRRVKVAGVRIRSVALTPCDVTTQGGIPILTIPRALVDLAGVLDRSQLSRAVDRACRMPGVSPSTILDRVQEKRHAALKGVGELKAILRDRLQHGVPESELETDGLALLERYGLPLPIRQYRTKATGRRVRYDLIYVEQKLVVEFDGRGPHWGKDAWQADHDRDNAIELAGCPKLAFTWDDVHERGSYVPFTVADALGLVPSRWRKARKSSNRPD